MRLFIKQKVFTLSPQFTVKEENGNDRYTVRGHTFSMNSRLEVFNSAGQQVARIYRMLFRFLPRYVVEVNGQQVAEIVKDFTFFKPSYRVEGSNMRVEGDFWSHEYSVYDGQVPVMQLSKEWFSWGDSYVLNILDDRYELICLAIVLAIDCVLAAQNSGS